METTPQILVVGSDPMLKSEFGAAVSGLRKWRPVVHFEPDVRQGVEAARSRRPDLVCVQIEGGSHVLRSFAEDIKRSAPGTAVAALYRNDGISVQESDPAVFIEAMRADVQDFLRRPLASSELEAALRRHFQSISRGPAARGRILSFVGNKGGVGKSALSLSASLVLARRSPGRVLLIDASLQHGAMCELLDLTPQASICDAARQIDRLDERLLRTLSVEHHTGLRVLAAPKNALDAAPVDDQVLARILTVARQAFDYVVVDTFPLLDSITVAILDVSDRIFVVLSDLLPAVLGTGELLGVLERLGVSQDRVRVVLNHNHKGFAGRLADADVATRLGYDVDFVVPYSRHVLGATNSGEPYILRAPRWRGFGRAVRSIEEDILAIGQVDPDVVLQPEEPPRPDGPDAGASEDERGREGPLVAEGTT